MVDFHKINAFEKGQRDSFEDLLRVLAKKEPPAHDAEYQPIDGRGGDGGVEALWITADGKKIGYQAKYFWSFGDAQLRQMDKSVEQAIATHHELKKYVFAIPFDPTGKSGSRGMSGWEKWKKRVKMWKTLARKSRIDLEFELWAATDIAEKILLDENLGLHRHWFKEIVLNDAWFCSQIASAVQRLDDRFNPEDHVDVDTEALFDSIVRGPSTLEEISSAFERVNKARLPSIKFEAAEHDPDEDILKEVEAAWYDLSQSAGNFTQDLAVPWRVGETLTRLSVLLETVEKLELKYISVDRETLKEADQRMLEEIRHGLRNLSSSCHNLRGILNHHYLDAEKKRCCLVSGPAGAGKSHLLANVAEKRVKLGLPTVLLLGQDYSNSSFWLQTGKLLELNGQSSKEILETLNAVGLRKNQRVLLLFDAINEGAGSGYWRSQIPGLIKELKNYSHVAMAFSCREEYVPYAVSQDSLKNLASIHVSGFFTPEELERAAIRYLDEKGIVRPSTPFLEPEFSNPLFLKSVSEALVAKGETEFPRGLRGISRIIAFYLDALSWRVETAESNAKDISKAIKRTVKEVASKMAEKGIDYLDDTDAIQLIDKCFSGRISPGSKNWLQVLREASLFRLDAPPFSEDDDPLNPQPERVRFTFQRFQDYLMADALTEKIKKGCERKAFAAKGPLSFLFKNGQFGGNMDYQFAGLVSALSTTFPEKLGVEFAKALPKWEQTWKSERIIKDGFAESIRSRKSNAFSEQTHDLLNKLDGHSIILDLFLDVSMSVSHPYNAIRLHKNLKKWSLPERDSIWTWWVNQEALDEHSQIERIVSWALDLLDRPADIEHLKLASIVLTWCLSSSYMTLRDRATKALTTIFLSESSVFKFVAQQTYDCDDPYVIERLYAAAFGACCLDPAPDRLSSYSKLIYDLVFSNGKPPVGLLARDYALGVIELAEAKGALSKKVYLSNCYHPFSSEPPTFNLKEQEVKKIAERAGGKRIFRSASSEIGDYGKYSIPGRVRNFLTAPVGEPRPLTDNELKEQFLADVIEPFQERVAALNDLENLIKIERGLQFQNLISESLLDRVHSILENRPMDDTVRRSIEQHTEKLERSRKKLEQHLSVDEQKRLSSEYLREGNANEEDGRIRVDQCRLWVTKRAYELGWTAEQFPDDQTGAGYVPRQNDLERIGKKYQRIALDELQARLADNFWTFQDDSEIPTIYRYSDHDFRRNIEPTILPTTSRHGESCRNEMNWVTQPKVSLPKVDDSDLVKWPFQEDPTASLKSKIFRTDQNRKKWLVLYEFSLDTQKHDDPHLGEHGTRYEEFRFIYCVLARLGESTELVKHLRREKSLDVSSFRPREFADGPYLLEAHWRDTWQSQKFSKRVWDMPDDLEIAIPVADYHWESHLDKTLPEGFSRHLPHKWFSDELGLKIADRNANSWMNSNDDPVLFSVSESEGRSTVVIDEETFVDYASQFNMEPVWIMIAERSAWPSGGNDSFRGRRAEAVAWYDNNKLIKRGWKHDT